MDEKYVALWIVSVLSVLTVDLGIIYMAFIIRPIMNNVSHKSEVQLHKPNPYLSVFTKAAKITTHNQKTCHLHMTFFD